MLTVGNLAVADQTLLTTMVSQDPVYVDFDPDEHSYLRYSAEARRTDMTQHADRTRWLGQRGGFPARRNGRLSRQQGRPGNGKYSRASQRCDNRDRAFTPGLYARVQVSSGNEVEAILIDDKAVLTDQDRKYVYVLGSDNTAQRKDIQPGRKSEVFAWSSPA